MLGSVEFGRSNLRAGLGSRLDQSTERSRPDWTVCSLVEEVTDTKSILDVWSVFLTQVGHLPLLVAVGVGRTLRRSPGGDVDGREQGLPLLGA